MATAEHTMPDQPTLADLYQLLSQQTAQITNLSSQIATVHRELTRANAHQADDIRANAADIRNLQRDYAAIRVKVEALDAWRITHQFTCPFVGVGERQAMKTQLYRLMEVSFDKGELDAIIYDLGENPAELEGDALSERVRAIVSHFERRGRVGDLLTIFQERRPNITWPMFLI